MYIKLLVFSGALHNLINRMGATSGALHNLINRMGVTSGAGTTYASGALSSPPVFSGGRVTRSLVLCVCFVDRCLSFCPF